MNSDQFKTVTRNCPSCDSNTSVTIGKFIDKNSESYRIPPISVPLRKCNNCRMLFFDLIDGINTKGEIYESLNFSLGAPEKRHYAFKKIIEKLWQSSTGLELGAGYCHVGNMLSENQQVVAVDKYGQASLSKSGKVSYLDLNLMTLEMSQFAKEAFDYVLIDNVLEHLPSYRNLLEYSRFWLKNSGCIIVAVPNGRTIKRFIGEKERSEIHRPVEHVNIFVGNTLDKCFSEYGFVRSTITFLPKSIFEICFLMSLLGFAPFGLYRVYKKVMD